MHECDCHIGCLSGSVTRVGQELSGSVSRIGAELCGSIIRVGQGLSGYVNRIGTELCGSVTRIGQELCGSVTLVCSVYNDSNCWRWDAGEILLWDNNILIDLEWE